MKALKKYILPCILMVVMNVSFLSVGLAEQGSGDKGDKQYVLRMGLNEPENFSGPMMELRQWLKDINTLSDGRLTVENYWRNLGRAKDFFKMMDSGMIDIGSAGFNNYPEKYPVTSVVQLPFIIAKPANIAALMNGMLHDGLLAEYNQDVKHLMFKPADPYMLFTRTSVKTIEDLKGKKIRANGQGMINMFKALGATPVSLSGGEVYSALERGVIDGLVTSPGFFYPAKIYEVCKYALIEPLAGTLMIFYMKWDSWNNLPCELQMAMEKATQDYFWTNIYHESDRFTNDYMIPMQKAGVILNYMTKEERERWVERTSFLIDDWIKSIDAKGLPGTEAVRRARILSGL